MSRAKLRDDAEDVRALALLTSQIKQFSKIGDIPEKLEEVDAYKKRIEKELDNASGKLEQVKEYTIKINSKIEDINRCLNVYIHKIKEEIQLCLSRLKEEVYVDTDNYILVPSTNRYNLEKARQLQMLAKEIMNSRLNEFMQETENCIAIIRDNACLSKDNIDTLKGCLENWKEAKNESYQEETRKLKKEAEKERREQEEKLKRKQEQKKRREEEERKRKEELIRKQEEERKIKEEEDKRKREEEEIMKKERELRFKMEEEARLRKEEEKRLQDEKEMKMREMEEKRRLKEEEDKRKERERQLKEVERRENERLRVEQEEKAKRLDPNNWEPIIYNRQVDITDSTNTHTKQADSLDCTRSCNDSLCCVVLSPPGSITKEDVECTASDEVDSQIDILDEEEKLASYPIKLNYKKGMLCSEVPSRVYVPHFLASGTSDELVVKVSVNGGEWSTTTPIKPISNINVTEGLNLVGVELNDFETASVVIVTRPRGEVIMVDKPGIAALSKTDKNVNLFVPRNAFQKPTPVNFLIQEVSDDNLLMISQENENLSILSVSPLVTVIPSMLPSTSIEVDLLRKSSKSEYRKLIKGLNYQLCRTGNNDWKISDIEYKKDHDVSFLLPAMKGKYKDSASKPRRVRDIHQNQSVNFNLQLSLCLWLSDNAIFINNFVMAHELPNYLKQFTVLHRVMEIELSTDAPKDKVIEIANAIEETMTCTPVQVIVKQRESNLNDIVFQCVCRDKVEERLAKLRNDGYSIGPKVSQQFAITEGSEIEITFSGNICSATGSDEPIKMVFYQYMDNTKREIKLNVRDEYKQKDSPDYFGIMTCTILQQRCSRKQTSTRSIVIHLAIPKVERARDNIIVARVRFPSYLSALVTFISWRLYETDEDNWKQVLTSLFKSKDFQKFYRQAKRKCSADDSKAICRAMLTDWMKKMSINDDKVNPILISLKECGLHELALQCQDMVEYHKENMSDMVLHDFASKAKGQPKEIGQKLEISEEVIEKLLHENSGMETDQVFALLKEWSGTENALKFGNGIKEALAQLIL